MRISLNSEAVPADGETSPPATPTLKPVPALEPKSDTKGPGSAHVPESPPVHPGWEAKFQGTARVSYSRRIRRMTLQRFLCSMVAYRVEKVTFHDVLTLYDNLLWCQEKARMDPHFQDKFGEALAQLTKLLKETRFHPRTFGSTLRGISHRIRAEMEHFLIPERNLNGVEKHVKGLYHVLPHREPGVPKAQLPPKKVIGVGYKDKGHRKDPAFDGSPRWQEVAVRGNLE